MNIAETIRAYSANAARKTGSPAWRLLLLGILAGLLIGTGGTAASVVTMSIDNPSLSRLLSGLVFPMGLGLVMITGAELFTGNCMLPVGVLDGHATVRGMLRNWGLVYLGNFLGSVLLAAMVVFGGAVQYGGGALAVHVIRLGAAKCALSLSGGFTLGVICNVLVCVGVLCASSAKDVPGKIMGAYLPIFFFIVCGFEHCVANMYIIFTGVLARAVPAYAAAAASAGVDAAALSAGGVAQSLLSVSAGNIVGGVATGLLIWACHGRVGKDEK